MRIIRKTIAPTSLSLPAVCVSIIFFPSTCLHEMEERRMWLLLSCTFFSFRFLEIDTSIFETCHRFLVQMMDGADGSAGSAVDVMNVSGGVFLNRCPQHLGVRDLFIRGSGIIFGPCHSSSPPYSVFYSHFHCLFHHLLK